MCKDCELFADLGISYIVGLNMVVQSQVLDYFNLLAPEAAKLRNKWQKELASAGMVIFTGKQIAKATGNVQHIVGQGYCVKLSDGNTLNIGSGCTYCYTAQAVKLLSDKLKEKNSIVEPLRCKPIPQAEEYPVPIPSEVSVSPSGLQVFTNPEFGQIRTVEINGEPWLVGKDVATVLGYQNGSRDINRHVDEEDRKDFSVNDGIQNRNMTIINESGLYSLVISSKLPGAKKFKRWVTSEVLPSIRKHGAYMTDNTLDKMIASPEFGIKLLSALKEERDRNRELVTKVDALNSKIEIDRPKVEFADDISGHDTTISIGDFAKILSKNGRVIGRNRFYAWLREQKILNEKNIPYQAYIDSGCFEVIEVKKYGNYYPATRITGKGQRYLHRKFVDDFIGAS